MIDETTQRFLITGITKENEQSVIDKLERSGFTNWWQLPEDTANYIYVSHTWNNKYMKMWGLIARQLLKTSKITAEEYLYEEVNE